jgi:hypothetical protein
MTSRVVNQQRVFCNTESTFVTGWSEETLTYCPNNNTHDYDPSSITIIDTVTEDEVIVQEEETKTGGRYAATTAVLKTNNVPDVTTIVSFSWPFPVNVLASTFITKDIMEGDILNVNIAKNTTVGAIAANVSAGATSMFVTDTVVENSATGIYMRLVGGTTVNEVGRIINVYSNNNLVTFETPTSNSFSVFSPTYCQITAKLADNFTIGTAGRYVMGESKIGGNYVPANVVADFEYTNKGNTEKSLYFVLEYLY